MAHPWANVFILVVGGVSLASGFLGLLGGAPEWAPALHVHRVSGYALVALLAWKGRNIVTPLMNVRRWRRRPALHLGGLALLALLLTPLALGLAWSFGGYFAHFGFSGLSWHIYLSLALAPFVLWHVQRHTWTLRTRFWAERRSFLRLAGLGAAGFAVWQGGKLAAGVFELPGTERRFTGSYERGSFAGNRFPTTSWLNDNPPPVDKDAWRLKVTGLVDRELDLSLADLSTASTSPRPAPQPVRPEPVEGPLADIARDPGQVTATLDCTGGWHSTQEWEGAPLLDVLERAGADPEARSVAIRSVTGYRRRFSMAEARGYLLATRVGGEPLWHGHGSPVRLVAPGKRGFEWVKWVTSVSVDDAPSWWQSPLPLT